MLLQVVEYTIKIVCQVATIIYAIVFSVNYKFYTDLSKKYLKNVCIKYINVEE